MLCTMGQVARGGARPTDPRSREACPLEMSMKLASRRTRAHPRRQFWVRIQRRAFGSIKPCRSGSGVPSSARGCLHRRRSAVRIPSARLRKGESVGRPVGSDTFLAALENQDPPPPPRPQAQAQAKGRRSDRGRVTCTVTPSEEYRFRPFADFHLLHRPERTF